MPVKTTILLRDEIYEYHIKSVKGKGMFGVDPWLTTENLRDEEEPIKVLDSFA